MNFKSFVNSFEAGDPRKQEFPVFYKRIILAKEVLNNKINVERTVEAPEFLTDFGLRKFESPYLLASKVANKLKLILPDPSEIIEELLEENLEYFTNLLDMIILVLGNYDIAYKAVSLRKYDLLKLQDFEQLLKIATLCAAVNRPQESELFFKRAIALSKPNSLERVMLKHRLANLYLKRKKDISSYSENVNEIVYSLIDEDDKLMLPLLSNLVSLELVLRKSNHKSNLMLARILILNAKVVLKSMISVEKEKPKAYSYLSELVRYFSQISLNQIQIELELKNYDLAQKISIENIEILKKYNPDYLNEALSAYAYVCYKSKLYLKALKIVNKAIIEHEKIGNIVGLNEIKKLKALILYKCNDIEQSNKILSELKREVIHEH